MLYFLVSLNDFTYIQLEDQLTIGRIHFRTEGSISRKHCEVSIDDNKVFIEDLKSSNGTKINDGRIDPFSPKEIKNGDILKLGTVSFHLFIGEDNFDIKTEIKKLQINMLDDLAKEAPKEMLVNKDIDEELEASITVQISDLMKKTLTGKIFKKDSNEIKAKVKQEGKRTFLEFNEEPKEKLELDKQKKSNRKK